MSIALYELADDMRAIFARIEDAGGELTPELEAELEGVTDSLEHKVDGCCIRIAEWGMTAASLQAEIDRLQARKQAYVNNQTRLKEYVRSCLEKADLSRVETARYTVRVQSSGASARWTGDPDDIPAAYRREKTSVDFDKKSAVADWKAGLELPVNVVVSQGKHLVIS